MKHLFGKPAFTVGPTVYYWEDVRIAAELWGTWERVTLAARRNLALVARYEAEDEVPFTDEEAETFATEFRYERDLVTAEEMEAWLARWDLDIDDWSAWITARLLAARWTEEPAEVDPEPGELARAVYTEALCSKALVGVLEDLAGRAAVVASLVDGVGEPPPASDEELLARFQPALREGGIEGVDPETLRERMLLVARVDRGYRHFEENALSPAAVSARLRANQTTWTTISYRMLSLPREDVAREALLGVREDGLSLEEVAADARAEVEVGSCFVDEFETAVRDRFIACQKGDLLGPLPMGGRFALVEVVDKTLPSSGDDAALAQARTDLLENLVSRERDNRVHWPGMR